MGNKAKRNVLPKVSATCMEMEKVEEDGGPKGGPHPGTWEAEAG